MQARHTLFAFILGFFWFVFSLPWHLPTAPFLFELGIDVLQLANCPAII